MTAEPWFAAYERAAFDENGKLRRFTQTPVKYEKVPRFESVPPRSTEGTSTMPTPPSLWGLAWGLLRLIGGRR